MRVLLLMRGAPGVGKTTFIKENNLEQFALSADDIRLLCQSPVMTANGSFGISQDNEKRVWSLLFQILEARMMRGEFVVIDATNSKTAEMNRYKTMAQTYRYRIYCVDFTTVPMEECKRRNISRPEYKRVPEEAIEKMYARFATQPIPTGITQLRPDELDRIWFKPIDLSKYNRIHHIGDIHGCNTVLQEYIVRSYFGNQIKSENTQWDYSVSDYWKTERWLSLIDFEDEHWKDIDEYEGLYQISTYGRVKSLAKEAGVVYHEDRILIASVVGSYLQVVLSKDGIHSNRKIHSLVAEAFLNGKDELCVNHIDTNRLNNHLSNLEYCSTADNVNHSVKLFKYGNTVVGQYDTNGNFIKAYVSTTDASRHTGIDRSAIAKVCKHEPKYNTAGGYVWKYLSEMNLGDLLLDDNMYIFCGDYIDRGKENIEVIQFLYSIMDRSNVLMLEGNHERWLWYWSHGGTGKSPEFEKVTRRQLEAGGLDTKVARMLYRKFGQCAYYKYRGKTVLVTHAGLSFIPDNLTKLATEQMIRGVGRYNDYVDVAQTFDRMAAPDTYQVFGHRNTRQLPIEVSDRCFDLEGSVEFGGDLRCLTLDADGFHTYYTRNTVFQTEEETAVTQYTEQELGVMEMIDQMRQNKYITEKKYGNISSFNFTREAFYDKKWNRQTTKARGLFLNTENGQVVARSYDKFFNVNEMPETKFDMLQHKLKFPVTAYVKENGFLGMVSYNPATDDFFITSKSDPQGDFSAYLRSMFYQVGQNLDELKNYMKNNNVTFVFECVDMENDPHIIKYETSKLFLLDVVKNQMQFEKLPYSKLAQFEKYGFEIKKKAIQIDNWTDFYDWYNEVMSDDYLYEGKEIEGFVVEDGVGYMVKLKLAYYKLWKHMRSVAHSVFRTGHYKYTGSLLTAEQNQFYGFVKELAKDENRPTNIIALRDLFFASKIKGA